MFRATSDGAAVTVVDESGRASTLADLGYDVADNLTSDVVVLTEGVSDIPVIQEFLLKRGVLPCYSVKMWPLGGDAMQHIDLSALAGKGSMIAMVDRDPGSNAAREAFIAECQRNSVPVHRLERYSIENYFTVQALRAVFKGQVPASIHSIDDARSLEDQLGFNVKRRNRNISREMSNADIAGTDFAKCLDEIERLCSSG